LSICRAKDHTNILCDRMERIQRDFLWDDTEQIQKPHLIKWDVCCLTKNDGGLGIRKPHQMNIVFLMKMLWIMINRSDDLWCKVLYSNYGRNKDQRFAINSRPYDSPLWKALAGISDQFHQHIVWQVGDGRRINFWIDRWVPNGLFSCRQLPIN
jgi:hypothetical protein